MKEIPKEIKKIVLEDNSWMCCELCWETFTRFELWGYDENDKALVCLWGSETYTNDDSPYDELRDDIREVFDFYGFNVSEIKYFEDYPVDWEYEYIVPED